MSDAILDPFHRVLAARLKEQIERRKEELASGSATRITEDTVSVAEKYAATVAYIDALKAVLVTCQEIEAGQHSLNPRPAQVTVKERG